MGACVVFVSRLLTESYACTFLCNILLYLMPGFFFSMLVSRDYVVIVWSFGVGGGVELLRSFSVLWVGV